MKKIIRGFLIALFLFLCTAAPAFAGGLNAAESRLYGVASGTFSVDGKTYRAYGNYLAQVYEYLCRDGVDLSDGQANSKISMMHNAGNIRSAAAGGYIYQIGGSSESDSQESDSKDKETAEQEKDKGKDQKDQKDKTTDQNSDKSTEQDAADTSASYYFRDNEMEQEPFYDENTFKASDIYKANKEVIEAGNSRSEELLEAVEDVSRNKTQENREAFDTVLSLRPQEDTNASDWSPGTVSRISNVIRYAVIGAAILFLAVSVLLVWRMHRAHCFRRQKKTAADTAEAHAHRKKIRRRGSVVLCVGVAVQSFLLFFGTGVQMSFFSYDHVSKVMSEKGIYHVEYVEMTSEVHELLKQESCMENLCDNALSYDDFLFDIKKQVRNALDGKADSAEHLQVQESVSDALAQVAYISDEDSVRIAEKVIDTYRKYTDTPIGDFIRSGKNAYRNTAVPGFPLLAASLLLEIVLLIAMQHYAHRGVRNTAKALGIAAAALGVCELILIAGNPFSGIYINSDALYVFVQGCIQWSEKVFGILWGVSVIAALIFAAAGRILRLELKRK